MPTACTIIACNYLPFATVLADSFFAHHPGSTFTILLIDDEGGERRPDDPRIAWRTLADLGLAANEIHRLAGIYDVTELATAVKPLLLMHLLAGSSDPVLYLDPDIRIYAPLDEAFDRAAEHGIVLTPHSMQPYPRDRRQVEAAQILASGVYNLGFIGVSPAAQPFLDWWWSSTRREALNDLRRMMFTDQRWADFAPCFYDHHILKNPGYNVAYWNLHGRDLTADGSAYLVDGEPLRFFHFSGFKPGTPYLLSKHQGDRPRILLSDRPVLRRLCDEYAAAVAATGQDAYSALPYAWNAMAAGLPLATRMRRLYRDGVLAADDHAAPEPPDPFDLENPGAFIAWLNAPADDGPRRVSRYLFDVYKDRMDLQIRFPDAGGADAEAFADWVWNYGVVDEVIPLELRPPARPPATAAAPLALPVDATTTAERVNVTGYFRAEVGVGEAARLLLTALDHAGLATCTTTNRATLSRQAQEFAERHDDGGGWDINVLCVNADSTRQFASDVGPQFFAGRHTVGYWFWELEQLPETMHPAFDAVDEVWTASDFVAEAVRAAGKRPVYTVPLPVPVPQVPSSASRAALSLPEGFTFLFMFDMLSVMARKNPLGLIEAYCRAFPAAGGPSLVIKTINGDRALRNLERLRDAAWHRPDIVILDRYVTAAERDALVGLCDCYVSLHRSEGLGLTMAEAMALAKPVIATGYSGNLQFMKPETSYLVDYTLVPVPPGCDPYSVTASWADPDLDQAAAFMREVYEQPDAARARARTGQADLLKHHGVDASAAAVAARIRQIRDERTRAVAIPGITVPIDTRLPRPVPGQTQPPAIEPLEHLLPQLDRLATLSVAAETSAFSGMRQAAQRLLFRILRPYAFQQRQLQQQLIVALRHAAAAIREEQKTREVLDARVRELTRELLASKRELRRLQGEAASVTDEARQVSS